MCCGHRELLPLEGLWAELCSVAGVSQGGKARTWLAASS